MTEPVHLIDTLTLPEGGELKLLRCGTEFSIQLDDEELMGNSDFGSEEVLATAVADRLSCLQGRILIGGLGMGFTLGAALRTWGMRASVEVAELLPDVIRWARGPLAHLFGDMLDDPRVKLRVEDVHDVIANADRPYDAILLDVDNGPDGFVQDANERIYSNWGLRSAWGALRPDGILAIWSAYEDADFLSRVRAVGFLVEQITVPAFKDCASDDHFIWLAIKRV